VHELPGGLKERVEALEARILRETLIRHRWNKSRAAEELGLSRVGLRNKLERYGLDRKLDA
jgi:two-component system, NtrC family, response regulator HupR/HoxA